MLSEAVLVPAPLGVKVTEIVQAPPAGSGVEVEQVVDEIAKSLALGPVNVTPLIGSLTLCVFVKVTVCGALVAPIIRDAKLNESGDGTSFAVPVALTVNVCGAVLASSLMVTVPPIGPAAVGVTLTAITQLAPPATGVPARQVVALPSENPLGKPVIDAICSGILWLLVSVIFLTTVLVISMLLKLRLAGLSVTGTTPAPESPTICGLLLASSAMESCAPLVAPVAVGWKTIPITQLLPDATGVPTAQVVVVVATANGAVAVMEEKFRLADWLFVTVTVCSALVAWTATLP
jgi:hypothetical protein